MAEHGTLTMAINHACDCPDCETAEHAYRADYRARNPRTGGPGPKVTRSSAWRETEPGGTPEDDPRWRADAACRAAGPDLFYPGPFDVETTAAARAVCEGCPVADDCLAYAMATRQTHGIWAGTSETDRRRMRRRGGR